MAEKKSKALKEYERGKSILEQREKELEAMASDIEELAAELEKLNEDINVASDPTANISREGYSKLIEARTELINSLQFEKQRAEKSEESALVTQLEYEKVTSELLAEANTKNNEIIGAMREHFEAIKELSEEALKNRLDTNRALRLWQVDVYRNMDNKLMLGNGSMIDGMDFKEFKKIGASNAWNLIERAYENIER